MSFNCGFNRSFYRHSNRFPFWSLPASLALILLVFPLTVLYEYSIDLLPYFKLRIFVFSFSVIALTYFALGLIKLTKIRNPGMAFLLGMLCGILTTYFSWVSWIYLNIEYTMVWDPFAIFRVMELRAENGAWIRNDIPVFGLEAWMIWGIEAANFIFIPAFLVRLRMKKWFFCETCDHWVSDATLVGPFEVSEENMHAVDQLGLGDKSSLIDLELVSDLAPYQVEGSIFSCKSCTSFHTLNMEIGQAIRDQSVKNRTLVHGLMLQKAEVDLLWDKTHSNLPSGTC